MRGIEGSSFGVTGGAVRVGVRLLIPSSSRGASGAIVGLGGLVFAYFNGRAERFHAERLARSGRLHEQRRLAYVEIARFLAASLPGPDVPLHGAEAGPAGASGR